MQLSTGPWSYNRFEAYEKSLIEGSKPDFLDKDGDGDKKESFKKALKDKKEDEGTCSKCGGDHDEDKHDKKDVKEGYADAIAKSTAKFGKGAIDAAKNSSSAVNKAINTAVGRKDVNEGLSGDRYKKALEKGAMYSRKESEDEKKRGKVGGRGGRSDFGAGDRGTGNKNRRRRGLPVGMEEQIIQSLIDDGLANNPVSAQIIAEHMSDEWALSILDDLN